MKDKKEKILISSLAVALVTSNTSFAMLRVHGKSEAATNGSETRPKLSLGLVERAETTVVKAILIKTPTANFEGLQYFVYERKSDDTADKNKLFTRETLKTVTDLMIDDSVTEITANRFEGLQNLTKLTFKGVDTTAKVGTIDRNAFKGTGLTSVVFPKRLTVIGEEAFANTTALTTLDFSNCLNFNHIKDSAFENSGLTAVDFSPIDRGANTLLVFERDAFKENRQLTSLVLSTKTTIIDDSSFAMTNIQTLHIPAKLTYISQRAFRETPLATITVDDGNTAYTADDDVLYNKAKTAVFLYPEGRVKTELTLPDSVKETPWDAFRDSQTLTKVVLGAGQTTIQTNAFRNTVNLTTLDLRKARALKQVNTGAFTGSGLNTMLIGEQTGPLNTAETNPFASTPTKRRIFFLSDDNQFVDASKFASLSNKYSHLKTAAYNSWTMNKKIPTPTASIDYTSMKLTNLEPSTLYDIQGTTYTSDATGKLDLLKAWGGQTLKIRRNTGEIDESDVQSLSVEKLYTLTLDGEDSLKKVGASITLTATERDGFVFTTWSWSNTEERIPSTIGKNVTFLMPAKDVTLTKKYTAITVETLASNLIFNGKTDVEVTLTSAATNFASLALNGTTLEKNKDYTVASGDKTTITFKRSYLDKLTEQPTFVATFVEGGGISFKVKLYGPAPTAAANYNEMKLTGLVANAQYNINDVMKTADEYGKITIEKAWSSRPLEIIKLATDAGTDSKPQNLTIKELYTITVDGEEYKYATEGTSITVTATEKPGHVFKTWSWSNTEEALPVSDGKSVTFSMPAKNVTLTKEYTEIRVETPKNKLIFDGKTDVEVVITSRSTNFSKLTLDGNDLEKGTNYTLANNGDKTTITLKKEYVDTLERVANFVATFKEGGDITFTINSYAAAPTAMANYNEMKLTSLVPNSEYKINGVVKTTDEKGKVTIEKAWGSTRLEIIKKATDTETDSKPQYLDIEALYTITGDGNTARYATAGTNIVVTAPEKAGHVFTTWTWSITGKTIPSSVGKKVTFSMPAEDVTLTPQYTPITVETPVDDLKFDGKKDTIVTLTSALTNFDKLALNSTDLRRDVDYTVTGGDKTTITLKKAYLDTLTDTPNFVATFREGGGISVTLTLYGPAPTASANYDEMKLINLEANAQYKINNEEKRAGADGKIKIEKAWGNHTLEIIKKATGAGTDSKPQNLNIEALYTVTMDDEEYTYAKKGTSIAVTAPEKQRHVFTTWSWSIADQAIPASVGRKVTFAMPAENVTLTKEYMEITVETPKDKLVFNGKTEVDVTMTSRSNNFVKLTLNGTVVEKDSNYTVTNGDKTIITLKKTYLDTLTGTPNFVATFAEGGDISFHVTLYGPAPTAVVNYNEMKLTDLVANAQYKINGENKTADGAGTIPIEKVWSAKALEIIQAATEGKTDSKPQNVTIDTLYTITIDEKEFTYTRAGTSITVEAPVKSAHVFKTWTWSDTTKTIPNSIGKQVTFPMPAKNLILEKEYTEIRVETPASDLKFDGKVNAVVTLTSASTNFDTLALHGANLRKDTDYTISGEDKTIITLNKEYLDTLTSAPTFAATFREGGAISFHLTLYGPAPNAVANYGEMKLTGLEPNTQYKVNGVGKTSDAEGKLPIEKAWGGTTLELIKTATGAGTDSKPQYLNINALYTITVDEDASRYAAAGTSITVTAPEKARHVFTSWSWSNDEETIPVSNGKNVTFSMPAKDVTLTAQYTQINVETPENQLVFNGKTNVAVTITSPSSNFVKLALNGTDLEKDSNYTVTGEGKTTITLKKDYLDTLTGTPSFVATFAEGGTISFTMTLYGPAPKAVADYDQMKLTGLVANAQYSINNEEKTADADGKLTIEKAWSANALEIIKLASGTETNSKPQNLNIAALYTITVDKEAYTYAKEGTNITVAATEKPGHVFTTWSWSNTDETIPSSVGKMLTFTMPAKNVNLTREYTAITVETPENELKFDGKRDVVVTLTSALTNFDTLTLDDTNLKKNIDYTVSGENKTIITLKKEYLDPLTSTPNFVATFREGGGIPFRVTLYGVAPTAVANYEEMKLTGLEANAQYNINDEVKTADEYGKIAIEKAWSARTLAIIKKATGTGTDSKPQTLNIATLYTITVDGEEYKYAAAGTSITVTAPERKGYVFTTWSWSYAEDTIPASIGQKVTFSMPAENVTLTKEYTAIIVETPENKLIFNGKREVEVAITSRSSNFVKLACGGIDLEINKDYTVTSGEKTIITLNKSYLDTLTGTPNFIATFAEGGNVSFTITLYDPAPKAVANYEEMKLNGLEANAQYNINNEVKTADEHGNITIEKAWSARTLEIIKLATESGTDSKPQNLTIAALYTITMDGEEYKYAAAGTSITVTAPEKAGYVFKTWTWSNIEETIPASIGKKVTFSMPAENVTLTKEYTAITVETPVSELKFDGKRDVVVTLTAALTNFDTLAFDDTNLKKNIDYTVSGENKTIITLKKEYLDPLTSAPTFVVTFSEGGTISFTITLYDPAPKAVANYEEMKLTGLEANAQYNINDEVKTADEHGNITIEKAWSARTLEIIKVATESGTDSKPQNLNIAVLYTITVDGEEYQYATAGTRITVTALRKDGHTFKEWQATGMTLSNAKRETITFSMPESNVALTKVYEVEAVITAVAADYSEMKLTGLEANAQYNINGEMKTSDAQGKINIEKTWGAKTLEIKKEGTGTQVVGGVQSIKVEKLNTVLLNGKELRFTTAGSKVKVKAESKKDYEFKGWKVNGVILTNAKAEEISFDMPDNDVELEPIYELLTKVEPTAQKPDDSKVENAHVKTIQSLVTPPKTGDHTNLVMYIAMLLGAGIVAFAIKLKKVLFNKH